MFFFGGSIICSFLGCQNTHFVLRRVYVKSCVYTQKRYLIIVPSYPPLIKNGPFITDVPSYPIFLGFSHGFPRTFPFSYRFSNAFFIFLRLFLSFSYDFPIFLWVFLIRSCHFWLSSLGDDSEPPDGSWSHPGDSSPQWQQFLLEEKRNLCHWGIGF